MNLLNIIENQVTGVLAKNASSFLGESESSVQNALGDIFPAILGSTINFASQEDGTAKLMETASGMEMGNISQIGELFSGGAGNIARLLNSGSGILEMVMGKSTGSLIDTISGMHGLKGSSTSSLAKMAAPFFMSVLGDKIKESSLDASGLAGLLQSQSNSVQKSLPSAIVQSLNLGSLADIGKSLAGTGQDLTKGIEDKTGETLGIGKDIVEDAAGKMASVAQGAAEITGNAVESGGKVISGAMKMASETGKDTADLAGNVMAAGKKSGSNIMRWIIPALLALLVLGYLGRQGCSTGVDALDNAAQSTIEATDNMAGEAGDVIESGAEMAGNAAEGMIAWTSEALQGAFNTIDEAAKKTLDGITFVSGSAGDQMMTFIKNGFKGEPTFTFKNLSFDTGSANISGSSTGEVDNIAAILKAYPSIRIAIEGYTDNTGNADANMSLSKARADAVKDRLVTQGVQAERMTSAGFGTSNPIASNDTEEGRAQNRRIEIKLVK